MFPKCNLKQRSNVNLKQKSDDNPIFWPKELIICIHHKSDITNCPIGFELQRWNNNRNKREHFKKHSWNRVTCNYLHPHLENNKLPNWFWIGKMDTIIGINERTSKITHEKAQTPPLNYVLQIQRSSILLHIKIRQNQSKHIFETEKTKGKKEKHYLCIKISRRLLTNINLVFLLDTCDCIELYRRFQVLKISIIREFPSYHLYHIIKHMNS